MSLSIGLKFFKRHWRSRIASIQHHSRRCDCVCHGVPCGGLGGAARITPYDLFGGNSWLGATTARRSSRTWTATLSLHTVVRRNLTWMTGTRTSTAVMTTYPSVIGPSLVFIAWTVSFVGLVETNSQGLARWAIAVGDLAHVDLAREINYGTIIVLLAPIVILGICGGIAAAIMSGKERRDIYLTCSVIGGRPSELRAQAIAETTGYAVSILAWSFLVWAVPVGTQAVIIWVKLGVLVTPWVSLAVLVGLVLCVTISLGARVMAAAREVTFIRAQYAE
ncbi:hypothetical protein KEM60_02880 [Austwickia sp. TVS 96-490-7B]|uniref:hypothetical protein n=1 Tax=Austwickia sp. TVS 96-490-7B TaxID=2830843 RepID=UPI001C55ACBE|nr:hypothetical protein [Austwickia sp. TVS 96-490-7B]MBW3086651.1 hypothetical protein [Austwickia sp. TVS 96-490-7B]